MLRWVSLGVNERINFHDWFHFESCSWCLDSWQGVNRSNTFTTLVFILGVKCDQFFESMSNHSVRSLETMELLECSVVRNDFELFTKKIVLGVFGGREYNQKISLFWQTCKRKERITRSHLELEQGRSRWQTQWRQYKRLVLLSYTKKAKIGDGSTQSFSCLKPCWASGFQGFCCAFCVS